MSDYDFTIIDSDEKESQDTGADLPEEEKQEVQEVVTAEETDDEKEDEYEKVCFICRRPESKAGKMIELPNNITVCQDCMQKSFDAMNNAPIDFSKMMGNMPGIQFLNLSDLENTVPKRQKIKKKKEKPKQAPAAPAKISEAAVQRMAENLGIGEYTLKDILEELEK